MASRAVDPLPSWNEGPTRGALIDFVTRVTTVGSPDFVPIEERIATFDNDGTLWSEKPVYAQVAFTADRVHELAPGHPDWQQRQPFKGVLEGNWEAVAATGERGLMELVSATHVGNTSDEFAGIVEKWITTARHPKYGRLYTELIYQPMRELIDMLHAGGFRVFIVSGGGVEFMRPWVEQVYGVPPDRVIGSRVKLHYELVDGTPVLQRLAEVELIDDGAEKPVGIHQAIGRRPLAAFGNSDGDFEMLEWTTSAPGPRLGMLVHHTDGDREYAYDRASRVGRLDRALDEAPPRGWLLADMKRDWKAIYSFVP